jgi:hypothetical protein
MNIEPLSKEIYEKCKEHGVKQIILRFSGGNDEGHLYVETEPYNAEVDREVDDWAWSVYEYNGAGDGNDYGDTITYDLVKGEVSRDEWYHSPQHINHKPTKLKVSKE